MYGPYQKPTLLFKLVKILVVPLSKLPDTVKLFAVAVPVREGLAKGAYDANAVAVAFVPSSVIMCCAAYQVPANG